MMEETLHNRHVAVAKALALVFAERTPQWDESREYCWPNVVDLVNAGLMGMSIPSRYGRQDASFHDVVLVVEETAKTRGPHRDQGQHGRDQRRGGLRYRRAEGALR